MGKFFGSTGSVSRVTVGAKPSREICWVIRRCASSMFTSQLGTVEKGLPLLVDLVGFPSSGLSDTNWAGFRENLPERLDRLIADQHMPPVVVAFPDCFARLGGHQLSSHRRLGRLPAARNAAGHWIRARGGLEPNLASKRPRIA